MRITIVTDAWYPQINGVVRTLDTVSQALRDQGHDIDIVAPNRFRTVPCPTYPQIRLALNLWPRLPRLLDAFAPDAVHIATEGPLGLAARWDCLRKKRPFTTSFHTRFPEYVHARFRLPVGWSYAWLRRFHGKAARTMVATPSVQRELEGRGFRNLARWSRGVDLGLFHPRPDAPPAAEGPRPHWLYVGRIAVEKNIESFLALGLDGTKIVVGDGPQMEDLKARYPEVRFLGARRGKDLAGVYAAADVFVFPSLTDTFGLVQIEAMASGVPVAAFPAPGPIDIVRDGETGALDEDLAAACRRALGLSSEACTAFAAGFSWEASAAQFLGNLEPFA